MKSEMNAQRGMAKKSGRLLLASLTTMAALAMLILWTAPSGWADVAGEQQTSAEQWAHMTQMRNIMHYGVFQAEKLPQGVMVRITSEDPALAEAIQAEFGEGRHAQAALNPQTEVETETLNEGVALQFTSENPQVVKNLQAQGTGLAYRMLRYNMRETMHQSRVGMGQESRGNGPGWGHHKGMGGGMGPGMGPGAGQGMGPGMGPGTGPGWKN